MGKTWRTLGLALFSSSQTLPPLTPTATLSFPEKCRAVHRINAPQCSIRNLRDRCWLHLRVKGMKPVMSMSCCCNFWLLIPSNLDSYSDFCPTPLTREAQKPVFDPTTLLYQTPMKGQRKPQNSQPNYSSGWRWAMPPPWLFSSALLDLYTAPPLSVNGFSTTRFFFLKKRKLKKNLSKTLPEEHFLHQNTSFLQLSPRFQHVSKVPPGKAGIVAKQYHWHRCPWPVRPGLQFWISRTVLGVWL